MGKIRNLINQYLYTDTKTRCLFDPLHVSFYENKTNCKVTISWGCEEWIGLAGGMIGAEVSVDWYGDAAQILLKDTARLKDPVTTAVIFSAEGTPLSLHPHCIRVQKEHQRNAIATRMLAKSASWASKLGFSRIDIQALQVAAMEDDASFNGAYTYGRLGFNGALSAAVLDALPDEVAHCTTLQQLLAMPNGIELWRLHAQTMRQSFDLSPGSASWAALNSYLKKRAIRMR